MSKMTVIQLLNKIANDKEVPKEIKYNACLFAFERQSQDYYCEEYGNLFEYLINEHRTGEFLNDEVEIIKENKKIEKLETYDITGNIFLEDYCFKYIPIDKEKLTANEQVFANKINEIIDYINGGTNGE